MTNELREKLINKANNGSKQEKRICNLLLVEKNIKLKKLEDFSNYFGCSNSSITRLARSLGYPSFPHFYHELYYEGSEKIKHINNDLTWYSNEAKKISNLISGKIYLFSSRRGKSIAKFLSERLNSINIANEYYHESWGRSPQDEIKRIEKNDTVLLITMNANSNLSIKYMELMKKQNNVKKIIVLTANKKLPTHDKIHHFSLSKIDGVEYEVTTFNGYNFACNRMIGLLTAFMKELYQKRKTITKL